VDAAVVVKDEVVAPEQQRSGAGRSLQPPERRSVKRAEAQEPAAEFADLYQRLAAPFDSTFKDIRGGVELEYITGEQCVSRLNEVLGVAGWSFRILEHGIHAEADEAWVLGELTASFGGALVTRQQFGSQKIKRSRSSGTPLDIGFDLKGAATDALKKCASLLGVGLYLSRKEAPEAANGATNGHAHGQANGVTAAEPERLVCDVCGEELRETRFRDGTVWTPLQLAGYGRRKHSRTLCMTHYREANDARRRAEVTLEEMPF